MKNKILKLNIGDKLKVLKHGGGSINYQAPLNLDFINKLIFELKTILKSNNDIVSFYLIHKDDFPAISNRFVEGMKTIFGNKKFEYKTTKLVDSDEFNKEILYFIYEANKRELEEAIYRLEEIKSYFNKTLNDLNISITKWFEIVSEKIEHNLKPFLENSIKNYFQKMSIHNISKTSLIRLLSTGYHKYNKLELLKDQIVSSDDDGSVKFVSFVSNEFLNKNVKKLNDLNIRWQKVDKSTIALSTKNIPQNLNLSGVLYVEQNNIELNNDDTFNSKNDNFYLYDKYQKMQIKNNVNIGVIDGGIQNEEFKKYITYHGIDEFESLLTKSKGTHAEEVCSILLFGDKLSPTLNDNCDQPNVHLFDVVYENITPEKLFELIEKIVEKYHETIKIWNLSISVENSIIMSTIWKHGISSLGNKIDELQKKFNVLFIVPSGNKDSENVEVIKSPSDSMLAISVGCSNYDKSITTYSLSGETNKNKYYAIKPDLSVRSENNNGEFSVLSNGVISKKQGTSFAAPWVARKVAHIFKHEVDLFSIPAILNAITTYSNNNDKYDNYFGHGILPNDVNEIINFKENKSIVITKLKVKDYSQGFFELKLPKSEKNEFPFNFVMSVNVIPNFSEYHSFEYVEDTVRVQFGAVSPFANDKYPKIEQNWKIAPIYGDADDAYVKEKSLRQYYGKYKNRYTHAQFIPKAKRSYISKNGVHKNIDNWGFSIVRNDIRAKRIGEIDVYICLIISEINGNEIYEKIANLNKEYIDLEISANLKDGDEITFE